MPRGVIGLGDALLVLVVLAVWSLLVLLVLPALLF